MEEFNYNATDKSPTVFIVPHSYDGAKAEVFLRRYCSVSARLLTRLKRTENGITRDGKLLRSIDILREGDEVKIRFPDEELSVEPVEGKLDVLFENNNVLVVNKPPYMPVHPVHEHRLDTLANLVAFYQLQHGESYTFRAVNRLDRNTSGIVIIAKNRLAASILPHDVQKTYTAICDGELYGSGTIDAPLALKEGHTIQREVRVDGVRAVTHWRSLEVKENHTLLKLTLETGRTHQIRAHMAYIGHPLAGDDMYGGSLKIFSRQCLHCSYAEFIDPSSNKKITVTSCANEFVEKFSEITHAL